jgi:hypothetical protein
MGRSNPDIDLQFASSSIDCFFAREAPKPRVASSGKIRIANMRDLIGFNRVATDTLVHVSQQDFWRISQDSEGHFIERLVDDDSGPVTEK